MKRALVLGSTGLAGAPIADALARDWDVVGSNSRTADLRDLDQVRALFARVRPDLIVHAAGRVGGIQANLSDGRTLGLDNTYITTNVLSVAGAFGVSKLIYLGSACCYPNDRLQPMTTDELFAGPLEGSSRAYALAKSLGIELVTRAHSDGLQWANVIPANLYGPRDNFDLSEAHVVAALVRRFHEASLSESKEVVVWGTGRARRQFLHASDLGSAVAVIAARLGEVGPVVNVGGSEVAIADLVRIISAAVGYQREVHWDHTRPEGTAVKLLDDRPLRSLGWRPRFDVEAGIQDTLAWLTGAIEAGEARGFPGSAATMPERRSASS